MRRQCICLTASISTCAALVMLVAAGHAAPNPVDTSSLRSDPLRFPTDAVTFPIDTVSFPSGPVQTETSTTVEVSLPADILFDFDKADIRPSAQGMLHEVAQLLRERAHGPVTVQGHTDSLGTESYNQRLSERRAVAVKVWLEANEGLAKMRFTIAGLGVRNPVAPNRKPDGSDDPEGRQRNRRVTFIIPK